MKVTKYPQSCLVIEKQGKRLIIDPGSFVSQKFQVKDLLPLDGILITHEHQDHADPKLIQGLLSSNLPVVGNQSTHDTLGEVINKVVKNGDIFEISGFQIRARDLPHCLMVDGSSGPQNTGFVIDDTFFHPGDGISTEGLKVNVAAVPIAGPDISPRDIYSFIRQINCKTVIPIHYDYFPGEPKFIASLLNSMDQSIEVVILKEGESKEL